MILYLNPDWALECGGMFRVHNPKNRGCTNLLVEPLEDTLVVFWSDQLMHSVLPSMAPRGRVDFRYALTLWLTAS